MNNLHTSIKISISILSAVCIIAALIFSILPTAGCDPSDANTSDAPSEQPSPIPNPTSLPVLPEGSICGTDSFPADYLRRISDCKDKYDFFSVELGTRLSGHSMAKEFLCSINFVLPKGWFCLYSPISDEAYLGGLKNLFDSRVYIYNAYGRCVGALGIRRSSTKSTDRFELNDDIQLFFSDINSDPDYRFTTDEYYLPVSLSTLQFEDRFSAPAITEVFYSKEYLESLAHDSEFDFMNLGIISRHEGDSLYLCFEFDSHAIDFIELTDIARSIVWKSIQEAV